MKKRVRPFVHLCKTADETDADRVAAFCILPMRFVEAPVPAFDRLRRNVRVLQHDVRKADRVRAFRRRIPSLQGLRREVMDSRCPSANALQLERGDAAKNGPGNMRPSSRAEQVPRI